MIEIWHNMMWPRYKAEIFNELYKITQDGCFFNFNVIQIYETDKSRRELSPVDISLHHYPYLLLFTGIKENVGCFELFKKLAKHTLASTADLIVLAGYDRPEYWLQLAILKARGKKVGVFCDSTIYDNPQKRWKTWAKSVFFRSCQVVLCYGQRSGEYVAAHGVERSRIQIGCQAAALPKSYDWNDALVARVKTRRTSPYVTFLYVGRLAPEKGLGDLIAAFAAAHEVSPEARLSLVGSGPEEAKLRVDVARHGIAPWVDFAGSISGDALTSVYRSATCLVLPSHREPWGLVVNEAFAQGCPAIVSDRCGCVPELIEPDVTGIVVPAGQPGSLSSAMLRAIERFRDTEVVASACIAKASLFSSKAAALKILEAISTAVRCVSS